MSWIDNRLRQCSRETPDRLWLAEARTAMQLTFGEAAQIVDRYRQILVAKGVVPGQRVLLAVKNPLHFALLWLAILDWGAVAVPLNAQSPVPEWERTIDQLEISWCVCDQMPSDWSQFYSSTEGPGQLCWAGPFRKQANLYPTGGVVLFTSGSTGEPKPVGLPLKSLWSAALDVAFSHQLQSSDRGYCPLPLFHVNAQVVALLSSLAAGSSLVLDGQLDRQRFWQQIDDWEITWANLVPTLLTLLLKDQQHQPTHPERIRFLRTASAPLPGSVKSGAEKTWGIDIVQSYGISEAAGPVTVNTETRLKPYSVGQPRGVKVALLPSTGGTWEIGLRGARVIDPEWGPNGWAKTRFYEGWYRTGDLGHADRDGDFYVDGRIKEVINRGGEKVFPAEVESVLLSHPMVKECAVVGRPNPVLGEDVVAYVVADNLSAIETELRGVVQGQLSAYKAPVSYIAVDQLPRNATGKLMRQHLQQRSSQLA